MSRAAVARTKERQRAYAGFAAGWLSAAAINYVLGGNASLVSKIVVSGIGAGTASYLGGKNPYYAAGFAAGSTYYLWPYVQEVYTYIESGAAIAGAYVAELEAVNTELIEISAGGPVITAPNVFSGSWSSWSRWFFP